MAVAVAASLPRRRARVRRRLGLASVIGLLLAAVGASAAATDPSPVVTTATGKVQGYMDGSIAVYRTIPFAQPPVDELRFMPPQPAKAWAGTLNATAIPPPCAQGHIPLADKTYGQEDCLTLNVYAPPTADDGSKVPVMLWLFGGGWVEGGSYLKGRYDGTRMATQENVVVVTINYRLGALGFLALPELQQERGDGSVGGMGLLDQTLAMKWVQANIGAFGGDASRVAIFGESAGGFSVCWHLANPASRGLFSAAIMESGTCESRDFFQQPSFAFNFADHWAASVDCAGSGAARLDCLRKLTVDQILSSPLSPGKHATQPPPPDTGAVLMPAWVPYMPWGAVIDGVSLPDVPLAMIQKGDWAKVPFLLGTNLNEGTIFVPLLPDLITGVHFPPSPSEEYLVMHHFFQYYTRNDTLIKELSTQTFDRYPLSAYDNSSWKRAARIMTDWFFTCGSRRVARAVAAGGGTAFLYHFTADLKWAEYDILGDYHSSEVDLVFGNENALDLFDKDIRDLSNAMQYYWTNMAFHGEPNNNDPSVTYASWPAYKASTSIDMDLHWPPSTETFLADDNCNFWDSVLARMALDEERAA